MRPLLARVLPALLASALATALVPVAASFLGIAQEWWWTGRGRWSAPAPLFGPHEGLAWLFGLAAAAVFAWFFVRAPERRSFRFAVGAWGLAQVACGGLVVIAWSGERWAQLALRVRAAHRLVRLLRCAR